MCCAVQWKHFVVVVPRVSPIKTNALLELCIASTSMPHPTIVLGGLSHCQQLTRTSSTTPCTVYNFLCALCSIGGLNILDNAQ